MRKTFYPLIESEDPTSTPKDQEEVNNLVEPIMQTDEELLGDMSRLGTNEKTDQQQLLEDEVDAQNKMDMAAIQVPQVQEPEMPSERMSSILDAYRSLRPSQERSNENLLGANLLRAGNKIAQGFAYGAGAKIDDGSDLANALEKQADRPTEQALQNVKFAEAEEMADPGSDISKFYREQAKALLQRLYPNKDYTNELENMSASQLEKLPGFKNVLNPSSAKTNRRIIELRDDDGVIRSYNVNLDTGEKELVGERGYAYGIMKDPRTEELISVSKSSPGARVNPVTGPTAINKPSDQLTPKEVKQSLPTIDRKILEKERDEFQKEVKEEKRIISEIGAISDSTIALATKNPNAAKTLGAQVAKIMQGSRLTDADVVLYTGRAGIVNKLADFASEEITGTISKDKAKDIKETLDLYNLALKKSLQQRALQAATTTSSNFSGDLNIKPETLVPIFYQEIENKKTLPSGNVRIKKDGKTGTIPKNSPNLQKLLKQGWKIVEE